PQTRYAPQPMPSFDRMLLPVFEAIEPREHSYARAQSEVVGTMPPPAQLRPGHLRAYTTHRDPVLSLYAFFDVPNKPKDPKVDHVHVYGDATIDPRSGALLSSD